MGEEEEEEDVLIRLVEEGAASFVGLPPFLPISHRRIICA
jgi:hypothetical protein